MSIAEIVIRSLTERVKELEKQATTNGWEVAADIRDKAEKERLKHQESQITAFAEYTRRSQQINQLTSDRDEWKSRAEAAEKRAAIAEEGFEKFRKRDEDWSKTACDLRSRIAELESQLSHRPDALVAVLEECRIAGIKVSIDVIDRQEFRVFVVSPTGESRSTYAPDTTAAASAITSIVCSDDFYPTSSFSRRRTPVEGTPADPTPSPTPTADPVEELLRKCPGEWRVGKDYEEDPMVMAGNRCICWAGSDSDAIAAMGNRYNAIVDAVNHPAIAEYINESPRTLEHWNKFRAALRPLLRKEAGE